MRRRWTADARYPALEGRERVGASKVCKAMVKRIAYLDAKIEERKAAGAPTDLMLDEMDAMVQCLAAYESQHTSPEPTTQEPKKEASS